MIVTYPRSFVSCLCAFAMGSFSQPQAFAYSSSFVSEPSGVITVDGSPLGVDLITAWTQDFGQAGDGTTVAVSASNSSVGAQRVCGVDSAGTPVDVAILSRPFLPSEATTTDGYNFKCTGGESAKARTAIQVKVAIDAVVLVVAPNGQADYCIKEVFNNGLTMEQLRILFSNYSLDTLLKSATPSTRTLVSSSSAPKASLDFSRVVPTSPPIVLRMPSRSVIQNSEEPGFTKKPPVAPRKPTPRPTLPVKSLDHVPWNLNYGGPPTEGSTKCSKIPALIAGPPSTADLYNLFAKSILPHYGTGETTSPRYFSGDTTDELVSYLQKNTNAAGFVSLPDYMAYKRELQAVHIQDIDGTNYGPDYKTLSSGQYPLDYNIYMGVRSDDSATLDSILPFFQFAYSKQGDIDVVNSGLIPLPEIRKFQMLLELGAIEGRRRRRL